jgi:predicted MFS family arabinose efflux permease
VLFVTHLPDLPFYALVLFFPVFMVALSSRMVPMQALLTTVPAPQTRGAFLSANSAVQALGTGIGAWLGGQWLTNGANGAIVGFGQNGWIAAALTCAAVLWVSQVKGAHEGAPGVNTAPTPAGPAAAAAES